MVFWHMIHVSVCTCPFSGMGLKPAPDELVLGQVRDWNEELQTARELPSDTVTNKIFRERSLYKVCYIVHCCTDSKLLSHNMY